MGFKIVVGYFMDVMGSTVPTKEGGRNGFQRYGEFQSRHFNQATLENSPQPGVTSLSHYEGEVFSTIIFSIDGVGREAFLNLA